MPQSILDGLSLVDATGRAILAANLLCLLAAVAANLFARGRYARLNRDLQQSRDRFVHPLLNHIVDEAVRSNGTNSQAIIEDRFQLELKPLLVVERFVRAATGLVIILGLLGTFYGLTLSIGRIVHLVSADSGGGGDVAGAVTTGLTHALAGMAVAFSNSLLGIAAAVLLTVLGVFSNLTDRRNGLMLQIETHLDRMLSKGGTANDAPMHEALARLEEVVGRFEAGLARFADSAGDFHQFNAHLKDNIQRMSLSFGDFSDTLKGQLVSLKSRGGG